VDLGWPWWATTLVAAVIAGAAALAFVFVRRPLARGVLAVLVVEGILVAALAPVVMDESSMTVSGVERLSKDEYSRRADDICKRLYGFVGTLGNPSTLPGVARQLDALMPALWQAYGEQGLLVPPRSRQGDAMTWMNTMARYSSALESVHAAAKRGDGPAMKTAGARVAVFQQAAQRVATELGMRVCFQP
jgi:hypothetical protein